MISLVIAAPNNFSRDWLESRYANIIRNKLKAVTNKSIGVKFISREEEKLANKRHKAIRKPTTKLNSIHAIHLTPLSLDRKIVSLMQPHWL